MLTLTFSTISRKLNLVKFCQEIFIFIFLLFSSNFCIAQAPPVPNAQNSGQVKMTASIATKVNSFQLSLSSTDKNPVYISDEITYTINYGSYLSNSVQSLKVSAQWSRGTLFGSPIPSVDILDYIVGSGTTAYGNTPPIIDINNSRIEWTINNFPSNTQDQKVSFKLKINDSYIGKSKVLFDVKAYLTSNNTSIVSNTIIKTLNESSLEPTPIPSYITVIPTPIEEKILPISQLPISVLKIDVINISTNSAQINTTINKTPQDLKIIYGKSIINLLESVISLNKKFQDELKIDGLETGTNYYFKIFASNELETVSSDIYTFKTSSNEFLSVIDKKSLIISSDNNVLLDSKNENDETNTAIIIPTQEYGIKININHAELIKTVNVRLQDSNVLGINTEKAELNSKNSDLIEISNGSFVSHLISPKNQGFYDLISRIEDISGNIREEKIGIIRVINPLSVYNKKNKSIENAQVVIYIYNDKTKLYNLISQDSFAIKNPSYTDYFGQVRTVLPKGKYQVEVSNPGYKTQKINFTIGLGSEENLPKIILVNSTISIPQIINYYYKTTVDILGYMSNSIYNISGSSRFFNLNGIIIGIISILNIWCFLSNYFKIHWWFLPLKLFIYIKEKLLNSDVNYLFGKIIDSETGDSISGAVVYLIQSDANKVISKTITDNLGKFSIKTNIEIPYRITVIKKGYDSTPIMDFTKEGIHQNNLIISINKTKNTAFNIIKTEVIFKWIIQSLYLFTLIYLLSIELTFSNNFGIASTWIRLLIMCFNITLWFFTVFNLHEYKKNI